MATKNPYLSRALRDAVRRSGSTAEEVAEALGRSASTVRSRMNGQTLLDPLLKRDHEFVAEVCGVIAVEPTEVFEAAERLALEKPKSDVALLNLYLDTIEDPRSKPENKEAARKAVLSMISTD